MRYMRILRAVSSLRTVATNQLPAKYEMRQAIAMHAKRREAIVTVILVLLALALLFPGRIH